MNRGALIRLMLLAAVGGASGSVGGCDDGGTGGAGFGPFGPFPPGVCTAVGCGFTWDVTRALPTPLTVSEIQQLSAKVCRNDWCFTRSLADFGPPDAFMMGSGWSRTFPRVGADDPSIAVTFWASSGEAANEVQVTWQYGPPGAAGDVFSLELLRVDDTSLLRLAEAVTYEIYYPNNDNCGPRCERAIRSNR